MKLNEDTIQGQIFRWYWNNYCNKFIDPRHIIFSVPNGGKRTKTEAIKLKATGLVAGVSDLIIVRPDEVIFVEVKDATGTQKPKQKDFENIVTAMNYRYIIVRTLEEFKQKIK